MNSWLIPAVIASLLSTALLVVCYGYLYKKEKQPELKIFFIAWLFYSLRFIFKLVFIRFPEYIEISNLIYILTLLNGALLFIASRQLMNKKSRRKMNIILILCPIVVPILYIFGINGVIYTTIVFLISGIIYILVGVTFIRNQSYEKGLKYFIGIIFILWGLHKFDYPFLYDSIRFAPFGYLLGAIFSLTSALCILMLYYEIQKKLLFDKANALEESKEKLEETNETLSNTEEKLKIKIEYILSPESDEKHSLEITDIISIDVLQRIQDSFAEVTGVAAIITDTAGNPITEPSNFTEVCKIIRQTEIGSKNCIKSDWAIGVKSAKLLTPVFEECKGCGFIDAAAPILIGNKHIANWMIGQVNTGASNKKTLGNYADLIGVDRQKMLSAYDKIEFIENDKFQNIINLLWVFSQEISAYAYNNISLAKKIEEHKKVKSDLIQEKKRSEEHDRLKDAFLSNVSHEIRTPLNGILGFSDLLRSNKFSKEQRFNFIEMIEKSGKRLLNTIEDIVNISIIQTGQFELNKSKFNLNNLIDNVNNTYRPLAVQKGLEIEYNSDEQIDLFSDEEKIEVIITKLIDNAIKFTDKGRVFIISKQAERQLSVCVQDTGIGISEHKRKGAFRRFEQGENDYSRKHEGLGLGLSIAKAYAEALNGNIVIESLKNSTSKKDALGTKIILTLPNY